MREKMRKREREREREEMMSGNDVVTGLENKENTIFRGFDSPLWEMWSLLDAVPRRKLFVLWISFAFQEDESE